MCEAKWYSWNEKHPWAEQTNWKINGQHPHNDGRRVPICKNRVRQSGKKGGVSCDCNEYDEMEWNTAQSILSLFTIYEMIILGLCRIYLGGLHEKPGESGKTEANKHNWNVFNGFPWNAFSHSAEAHLKLRWEPHEWCFAISREFFTRFYAYISRDGMVAIANDFVKWWA